MYSKYYLESKFGQLFFFFLAISICASLRAEDGSWIVLSTQRTNSRLERNGFQYLGGPFPLGEGWRMGARMQTVQGFGGSAFGWVPKEGQGAKVNDSARVKDLPELNELRKPNRSGELLVWGGWKQDPNPAEIELSNQGWRYNPILNKWFSSNAKSPPLARMLGSGCYGTYAGTSDGLVVFGGLFKGPTQSAIVSIYDRGTDDWKSFDAPNPPTVAREAAYVLSPEKLFVGGGLCGPPNSLKCSSEAAMYTLPSANLKSGKWENIGNLADSPFPRHRCVSVWTGNSWIVWGGCTEMETNYTNTGAIFDPLKRKWSLMLNDNAPSKRMLAQSVWAGKELFVWGGIDKSVADPSGGKIPKDAIPGAMKNDGGIYDPISNRWRPINSIGAPSARYGAVCVFIPANEKLSPGIKSQIIIWGGVVLTEDKQNIVYSSDGARYDLESDTWTKLPEINVIGRIGSAAYWTGNELLVAGGETQRPSRYQGDVLIYTPPRFVYMFSK